MNDRTPRPTQLLVLEPADSLTFLESDGLSTAHLELTNPTPYPICFKVKTTASSKYCVRPKAGLMLPYSRRQVLFRLKEGGLEEVDKFKILSAVRPPEAKGTDPAALWAYICEPTCMQSKLGVRADRPARALLPAKTDRSRRNRPLLRWILALVLLSALATTIAYTAFPDVKLHF